MTRNYFSKHGGPYFKNDGFSRHPEVYDTKCVSLMCKIKSFFKSRFKSRPSDK